MYIVVTLLDWPGYGKGWTLTAWPYGLLLSPPAQQRLLRGVEEQAPDFWLFFYGCLFITLLGQALVFELN